MTTGRAQGVTASAAQWRGRVSLAMLAVCIAGPAAALEPVSCRYDPATQRLIDPNVATVDDSWLLVYPQGVAEEFVSWQVVTGEAPKRAVLQHCPSGQELLVVFPLQNEDAVNQRYLEMIFGPGAHTMRQIGEELARMGADARRTRDEFGTCACDLLRREG